MFSGAAPSGGFAEFKHNWLSDAGAYPVIGIISFALVFCAGVCTRCLLTNPDVRIDKKKRMSTLRTW
jgi:hypothetical protein